MRLKPLLAAALILGAAAAYGQAVQAWRQVVSNFGLGNHALSVDASGNAYIQCGPLGPFDNTAHLEKFDFNGRKIFDISTTHAGSIAPAGVYVSPPVQGQQFVYSC